MNELIPISNHNGQSAVNARDLHEFLESKQEFANWIKNRIDKYGLAENEDYVVFDNLIKNPQGGRPQIEYALTIDAAKELSMVEGNEKGKQARRYFIACERIAKEKVLSSPKKPSLALFDKMKAASWMAKFLNLDEHSKLTIAKSIVGPLGLPTPDFVEDEVMLPISKILSRKGILLSAQKANKKLLALGLLEKVERYSKSKGKNVQEYIISKKGKKFGKMHQFKNASFPTPVWFTENSDELIDLLGLQTIETSV